jgi:two-component system nitrate/nitrite response regulator NarL
MDTRVLIVDDDDRLREVLSLYISFEDGLQVAGTAASASEAAELAGELDVDAIVLDYHMPGMDGLAAIPLLLNAMPDVRIVMFSADDDRHASDAALALGVAGYVAKNGQSGLDDVMRLLKAS